MDFYSQNNDMTIDDESYPFGHLMTAIEEQLIPPAKGKRILDVVNGGGHGIVFGLASTQVPGYKNQLIGILTIMTEIPKTESEKTQFIRSWGPLPEETIPLKDFFWGITHVSLNDMAPLLAPIPRDKYKFIWLPTLKELLDSKPGKPLVNMHCGNLIGIDL